MDQQVNKGTGAGGAKTNVVGNNQPATNHALLRKVLLEQI